MNWKNIYKILKLNNKMEKQLQNLVIKKLKNLLDFGKKFISKLNIINKILVSNEVSFGKKGFKYFIGYKDAKKIRPVCIFLIKVSAYRRYFDETKYVSFSIKDD